LLHLVGDLFELYDDSRTYKPDIYFTTILARTSDLRDVSTSSSGRPPIPLVQH